MINTTMPGMTNVAPSISSLRLMVAPASKCPGRLTSNPRPLSREANILLPGGDALLRERLLSCVKRSVSRTLNRREVGFLKLLQDHPVAEIAPPVTRAIVREIGRGMLGRTGEPHAAAGAPVVRHQDSKASSGRSIPVIASFSRT